MSTLINAAAEQLFTADGTTSWLKVDDAPGLWNGRNWGLVYVLSTGDATADIMIEVKPTESVVIISHCDGLRSPVKITDSRRSATEDYNITRGMEVRAKVSNYSGSGSIRVRVDLGIS